LATIKALISTPLRLIIIIWLCAATVFEDAAVSRPSANFVFVDNRSAVPDHGPAHWHTSENHDALSDPAQFQYHSPHHALHNQQPFHSHARPSRSATHKASCHATVILCLCWKICRVGLLLNCFMLSSLPCFYAFC